MGPLKRVLIMIWSWSTAVAVCSENTRVDGNVSVNTEVSTGEADDKAASSGESDHYRLEEVLMKNYRPDLRPVHFHRTATNLSLVVEITAIQEVNEAFQTLRHSCWMNMRWTDQFLVWRPDHYGGIDDLEMPVKNIWTPTLSISNAASGVNFVTKQSAAHARVSSTGAVNWGPLGTYETTCRLDITFYPFDTQACDVVVDLWSSRESEVNATRVSAVADMAYFVENSEWKLTGLSVENLKYVYDGTRYQRFRVSFYLKRPRLFYTLTLIVPNVILALLVSLVFALPQQYGEKMSYIMPLLLAFAVNLSVLVNTMPRSSLNVSLLMIYLTSLSVVTALSVLTTVCLLRVHHKVEVVGPKVTAVVLCLRRLFKLRMIVRGDAGTKLQRQDARLDTETAQAASRDKQNCDVDRQGADWQQPAPFETLTASTRFKGGTAMGRTDGVEDKTDCADGDKKSSGISWKEVAETLDYVFFRMFVGVIVAMTSALVVTLFVGQ